MKKTKELLIEMMKDDKELGLYQEKPKQETLEEAAENYGWRIKRNTFSDAVKANELAESAQQDFIAGAKYQAKRMYSDMQEYAEFCVECDRAGLKLIAAKDWFNQFKKEK